MVPIKPTIMITKELAKQLIEKAEYNMSKQNVDYWIDYIEYKADECASLVIASSSNVQTSFVCYDDGTAYFLRDWQGPHPTNFEEIEEFKDWVTIDWQENVIMLHGLPRTL